MGLGWHRRHGGEAGEGGSGAPQPDAGLCLSLRHGGVRRGGDGAAHPHLTAPPRGSRRAGELQNPAQGSCPVAVPSRCLRPPLSCPVCARRLGASGSCWLLAWAGCPRRHRCRWLGSASCRRRGRASCRPIATSSGANGSRGRPRQPAGCPAEPSPSSSVLVRGHKSPPDPHVEQQRGGSQLVVRQGGHRSPGRDGGRLSRPCAAAPTAPGGSQEPCNPPGTCAAARSLWCHGLVCNKMPFSDGASTSLLPKPPQTFPNLPKPSWHGVPAALPPCRVAGKARRCARGVACRQMAVPAWVLAVTAGWQRWHRAPSAWGRTLGWGRCAWMSPTRLPPRCQGASRAQGREAAPRLRPGSPAWCHRPPLSPLGDTAEPPVLTHAPSTTTSPHIPAIPWAGSLPQSKQRPNRPHAGDNAPPVPPAPTLRTGERSRHGAAHVRLRPLHLRGTKAALFGLPVPQPQHKALPVAAGPPRALRCPGAPVVLWGGRGQRGWHGPNQPRCPRAGLNGGSVCAPWFWGVCCPRGCLLRAPPQQGGAVPWLDACWGPRCPHPGVPRGSCCVPSLAPGTRGTCRVPRGAGGREEGTLPWGQPRGP